LILSKKVPFGTAFPCLFAKLWCCRPIYCFLPAPLIEFLLLETGIWWFWRVRWWWIRSWLRHPRLEWCQILIFFAHLFERRFRDLRVFDFYSGLLVYVLSVFFWRYISTEVRFFLKVSEQGLWTDCNP